eukprot:ctg_897.g378
MVTPASRQDDIAKMLACNSHLGTKNCSSLMAPYVFRRRADGVHVINLARTWEKLQLAARIIATVETPADVVAVSARPYGQRAVLKFAQYTGATPCAGRWTPGQLTNQLERKFVEPRLLIVTDPRVDAQPVKEASYANIPTMLFAIPIRRWAAAARRHCPGGRMERHGRSLLLPRDRGSQEGGGGRSGSARGGGRCRCGGDS